jgi:hypothetical protein
VLDSARTFGARLSVDRRQSSVARFFGDVAECQYLRLSGPRNGRAKLAEQCRARRRHHDSETYPRYGSARFALLW